MLGSAILPSQQTICAEDGKRRGRKEKSGVNGGSDPRNCLKTATFLFDGLRIETEALQTPYSSGYRSLSLPAIAPRPVIRPFGSSHSSWRPSAVRSRKY